MGLLDTIKQKLSGAVDGSSDKIGQGLDKAGDFVDDKTGGKYSSKIDQGVGKAKDAIDGLDGKKDDFPDTPPTTAETPNRPDAPNV